MTHDQINTVQTEVARALPSVATSSLLLGGVPLEHWVVVGSATLILLQIIFLLKEKVYDKWKAKRDGLRK